LETACVTTDKKIRDIIEIEKQAVQTLHSDIYKEAVNLYNAQVKAEDSKVSKSRNELIIGGDDRPRPDTTSSSIGEFNTSDDKLFDFDKLQHRLPKLLVDMTKTHENPVLWKTMGSFLVNGGAEGNSGISSRLEVSVNYPQSFQNYSNQCHFNSIFQAVAACIVHARVDYINDLHPRISLVLRLYLQGKSSLLPQDILVLLARCIMKDDYFAQQQDASETLQELFFGMENSKQYNADWIVQFKPNSRCKTKLFDKEGGGVSSVCGFLAIHPSEVEELVSRLQVPHSTTTSPLETSIQALIDAMFFGGIIVPDYQCPLCRTFYDLELTKIEGITFNSITRFPKVLTLSTIEGRFYSSNGSQFMLDRRCESTTIVINDAIEFHRPDEPVLANYQLVGVVYHQGKYLVIRISCEYY
jgi:hypothetical protein